MSKKGQPLLNITILYNYDTEDYTPCHGGIKMPEHTKTTKEAAKIAEDWAILFMRDNASSYSGTNVFHANWPKSTSYAIVDHLKANGIRPKVIADPDNERQVILEISTSHKQGTVFEALKTARIFGSASANVTCIKLANHDENLPEWTTKQLDLLSESGSNPNIVGKIKLAKSLRETYTVSFCGIEYDAVKEGRSLHDQTPVKCFESEDGERIWVDSLGNVHADAAGDVQGLTKRFKKYTSRSTEIKANSSVSNVSEFQKIVEQASKIMAKKFQDSSPKSLMTVSLELMTGPTWSRLVRVSTVDGKVICQAAYGFLDKDGNLWKAASWKAPAKNKPRGTIHDLIRNIENKHWEYDIL